MWDQVQQLFRLYYKFHFLTGGTFNTTFSPCLKTSNFFLINRADVFLFLIVCVHEQKTMIMLHMCYVV